MTRAPPKPLSEAGRRKVLKIARGHRQLGPVLGGRGRAVGCAPRRSAARGPDLGPGTAGSHRAGQASRAAERASTTLSQNRAARNHPAENRPARLREPRAARHTPCVRPGENSWSSTCSRPNFDLIRPSAATKLLRSGARFPVRSVLRRCRHWMEMQRGRASVPRVSGTASRAATGSLLAFSGVGPRAPLRRVPAPRPVR